MNICKINLRWILIITLMTWAIFCWVTVTHAQYALPDLKVRGKPIRQPDRQQIQIADLYQKMAKMKQAIQPIKQAPNLLPSAEPLPLHTTPTVVSPVVPNPQIQPAIPSAIPYTQEDLIAQNNILQTDQPCPSCSPRWSNLSPIFHPYRFFFGPRPYRYTGMGQPLENGSWLNRPLSISVNLGIMAGDTIIRGNVDQRTDFHGDFRIGWDFDHYWGTEMRFGFVQMGLEEVGTIRTLDNADMVLWDTHLLFYPWGDSRWRPFLSLGFGITHYDFDDNLGRRVVVTPFTLPFGFGIKCRLTPGVVIRAEYKDNVAFGTGVVQAMNNSSIVIGAEFRFGGRHQSYWPWNPDNNYWPWSADQSIW